MKKTLYLQFHWSSLLLERVLLIFTFLVSFSLLSSAQCDGGELIGGPFEFCVDGKADMVSGITLADNTDSINNTWVVTDTSGNILGLPPMPGVVDFNAAGVGVCLIWNIAYEDDIEGLAMGGNVSDLVGCHGFSNSISVTRTEVNGGTLEGGPFEFCVDGTPDMVSDITLTENDGMNNAWLITDEGGNILGLPPMPGVVDFDAAGPGVCLIWNISFQDSLVGLSMDNNVSDLEGCYGLSNSISVTRSATNGGSLEGGAFEFCVDGISDMVSNIILSGNEGSNSQWVVTDAMGLILGLPPMPGIVDFDAAGSGVCLIWNVSYEEGLLGLEGGFNINDLDGCYGVSNAITVVRTTGGAACDETCLASGGVLEGGPFEFCVDGTPDMVSGITLNGNEGTNSAWVVTDVAGNILGLPPIPGVVDFDEAGAGVCLIWNLSYEEGLIGLASEGNIFTGLDGCYSISNAITVTRIAVNGGTLSGGPFDFCVDGEADNISGITLTDSDGDNNTWVVTDTLGNILGLPPMPGVVNFDEAGAGVCLIWNISYQDGLEGLAGGNNVSDLAGCYGFSNPVTVERTAVDGGILEGGPFNFCVDGEADIVSGITLNGNDQDNNAWVVTDTLGNILGLPPMPGAVDFDDAGPGICLIWNISYQDGLEGLAGGNNVADLKGCYGFSNPITVTRKETNGGALVGGPFEFCVDDEPDNVFGISLSGNEGDESAWIVTDTLGNILGLPPMPSAVDFNLAGPGVCLVWNISYATGLEGLEAGNNVSDLSGCYGLSNPVEVVRKQPIGGELIGQLEYEFCIDEEPDFIGELEVVGASGDNGQWVVLDPATGIILGLPDSPQNVDFNQAGPGLCVMGFITYSDGLTGLEVGQLAVGLSGCIGFSDASVGITRVTEGDVCTTSTDDEELFGNVIVYPNPAFNAIAIEVETYGGGGNISWALIDGLGRQLKASNNVNASNGITVDVSDVQSGIYYIKVGIEDRYILRKVSVLK
ncbi:MAG: hypothetical protein ACJATI_003013 [Halioglobus sp.]|jgi:hypothetical protein